MSLRFQLTVLTKCHGHLQREKALFAYDAEDHAADWWNDWGLLKERSANSVQVILNKIPVIEDVHKVVKDDAEGKIPVMEDEQKIAYDGIEG